jgi:starch-binding outer membrane protein, SusD/RagB family
MKRYISLCLCLFGLLAMTQCEDDFLDRNPPGVGSVDAFFKTEDELIAGINGVYRVFQGDWWGGAFIHVQPHLDGATDNGKICCAWEYEVQAIANGTMNPNTGGFVSFKWNFGYQALSRINKLLEVMAKGDISGLTPARAKKWEGELRFLRAFVYQQLMFYYGDVPLILKPITPAEAKVQVRTPRAEVLTQIIADLDFAAANLDNKPNNGEIGRPTALLANALKGRTLLYESKWADAATALQKVMALEGSEVMLDPNYESLFRGRNEQSKEILFSIQYVGEGQVGAGSGQGNFIQTHYAPLSPDGLGSGWQSLLHSFKMRDAYYMIDGQPITKSKLYNPDSVYERRDSRLAQTFLIPGYHKINARGDSVPYSTYRGFPTLPQYIEHQGVLVNKIPGAAGFGTKKWCAEFDKTSFSNDFSTDLILLRYADVLLMYAEARNEATGPDATVYAAVNKVRARAKMPPFAAGLSQAAMREEIRHERNVEFAMEGMRYNDLLRWRIAETVIPSIQNIEKRVFNPNKNYLWPIPQSVIDANPNIKQNPGY